MSQPTSFTVDGSSGITSINTGVGLVGGPINVSGTIAMADTAVTPGSYTLSDLTVDQQGRITAISNGSAGGGTVTSVTANAPITSTGGATPVIAANAELTALGAIASTGILARTMSATYAERTIVGTSGQIDVANGDGVSGNPTISLDANIVGSIVNTYARFSWNGGSTVALINSGNIASLTIVASFPTLTFTTPFLNANYIALVTYDPENGLVTDSIVYIPSQTATTLSIGLRNGGSGNFNVAVVHI